MTIEEIKAQKIFLIYQVLVMILDRILIGQMMFLQEGLDLQTVKES
jgi:hypothetical protein